MNIVWFNIKKFILDNILVLVFAILVGIASGMPQTLALFDIGDDYKGIPFLYQDDEYVYLSRIQEISDGNFLASSPMFHEYKNYLITTPPVPEYIYFGLSKLLNLSLISFVYLSKFLFPATLFLLVYILVFKLTERGGDSFLRKLNAITSGLLVTLGYDLVNFSNLFNILFNKPSNLIIPVWDRLVNPISGGIFLFLFLILIWEVLSGKRRLIIPSAIILFLMSGYIFSIGIAISLLFILIVALFLKKDYFTAKSLIYVFLVFSLLFSIFIACALNTEYIATNPQRIGLFLTHEPLINKLLVLVSFVFLAISALFYKKEIKSGKNNNWWYFSLFLIIASFLSYNQQILTGKTVWPQHFVQYSIPISIVVLMVIFFNFFSHKKRTYSLFLAVLILICFLSGIKSSLTYEYVMPDFIQKQKYGDVISWVNKKTLKNCVIFSLDSNINYMVPALTHCDVYFSEWVFSGVPDSRIMDNYLLTLKIRGVGAVDIDKYLSLNRREVTSFFYRNWMDFFFQSNDLWLTKIRDSEEINNWFSKLSDEISVKYKNYLETDMLLNIHKYKFDYFIVNKIDIALLNTSNLEDLNIVYEDDNFTIYKNKN